MKLEILTPWLRALLQEYNPALTVQPGTHEWNKIVAPILARFGNDPLAPSASQFVRDSLAAAFPDVETDILSANADIFAIPLEALMEAVRRETRQTQIASSIANRELLSKEELEGLLTSSRVQRTAGKYAAVRVRLKFSTPRSVYIPLNSTAFTTDGLEFTVADYYVFQPEDMLANRDGQYYYVEAQYRATEPGARYNVPPNAIRGVTGVSGVATATNPTNGEDGYDEESIANYLERLRSTVSSRSPDTTRGVTAMVQDVLGTYEVFTVGKGEPYMFRDIARWQLGSDDLQKTLFTGTAGTLVAVPLLFDATIPPAWTNQITGLTPPIPVMDPSPEKIVIGGNAYDIEAGTFSGGVPISALTFRNYEPVIGGANAGAFIGGYTLPGGARCPHTVSVKFTGVGVTLGGELWVYTAVSPWLGGIPPNAPSTVEWYSVPPGFLFKVAKATHEAGIIHACLVPEPAILRRSYGAMYALRIQGSAVVGDSDSIEMGTYDSGTSTFTLIPWQGNPEIPASPTPVFLCAEIPGETTTPPAAKHKLWIRVVLSPGGTMAGTVVALSGYDADYMIPADFNTTFPVGAPGVVLADPDTLWTLYTLDVGWFTKADGTVHAAIIRQLGPELLWYTAVSQPWSVSRSIIASDITGTLLLPSGVSMNTAGDIPLGGCSDIYLHAAESAGRTITWADFPDEDELVSDVTAGWTIAGGGTSGWINLPGSSGASVRAGDVVVIDHPTEGNAYVIECVALLPIDMVQVNHSFPGDVANVTFSVHRTMRADLIASTKSVHTGSDLHCGLVARVVTTAPLPSVVTEDCRLSILTGVSIDSYEIESVGPNWLDLDKVTLAIESGISYDIRLPYESPVLPISTISQVRVLSAYKSPGDPGGVPIGINLGYRLPVRIEAISSSITNGADDRIPVSYGYTGTVVVTHDDHYGYLGTLTTTVDPREFDAQTGDVLVLEGVFSAGNFYVIDYDDGIAPGTFDTLFIYIGENQAQPFFAEAAVPFGIYARHLVNLRLYFEAPLYAELGRVLPLLTPYTIPGDLTIYLRYVLGLTTFTSGGREYIVNPIDRQSAPVDVDAEIMGYASGSNAIFSSSSFGLETLRPIAGDIIRVVTIPLYVTDMDSPTNMMGTTLTVTVNGSPKTVHFRGTSNPIPVDSTAGYGGVKQQLEAALPVTVVVSNGSGPTKKNLKILSSSVIVVTGGGAQVYLPGITTGMSNVPVYAGEFEVIAYYNDLLFALPESGSLATFPTPPAPAEEMIVEYYRRGRKVFRPSAFQTAYGHSYVDVEAVSLGGGSGHALLSGETLTLGGMSLLSGFSFISDSGLALSTKEITDIQVSPYAPNSNGDLIGIADKQFQLVYAHNGYARLLQTYVTNNNYRTTSDDTLVKTKPLMRVGIGPIIPTAIVTASQLADVINAKLEELVPTMVQLSASDVLSWIASYGVLGTNDTRLIVHIQDVDRSRRLLLTSAMTINRLWRIQADTSLLVGVG